MQRNRVLIAVASRHGSTREIADAIADELREHEVQTTLLDVDRHPEVDLAGYDAAIIGSAIYMGRWLPGATELVTRNASQLARMPVWLFSSGPLDADEPEPKPAVSQVSELVDVTGAREHQLFVGKLDRHTLGFAERLVVKLVKAPDGDYRDWDAVRSWARDIASALTPQLVGAKQLHGDEHAHRQT